MKGRIIKRDCIIEDDVLIKYIGKDGSVILPENLGIKKIGRSAFERSCAVTSVTIPDSVTEIGNNAFMWCDLMEIVAIPEGVNIIGNKAFMNCRRLSCVTLPQELELLGDSAFSGCVNLHSISLPKERFSCGKDAFKGCPRPAAFFRYIKDDDERLLASYSWAAGDRLKDDPAEYIEEYLRENPEKLLKHALRLKQPEIFVSLAPFFTDEKPSLELIWRFIDETMGDAQLTASIMNFAHKFYTSEEIQKYIDKKNGLDW